MAYGGDGVCSDYKWKQCVVPGKWAMVGTLGFGVLVLLCILLCVLRCMCCQKRRPKKSAQLDVLDREEKAGLLSEGKSASSSTASMSGNNSGLFYDSSRFESRNKREEIRAKWGIKPSSSTVN